MVREKVTCIWRSSQHFVRHLILKLSFGIDIPYLNLCNNESHWILKCVQFNDLKTSITRKLSYTRLFLWFKYSWLTSDKSQPFHRMHSHDKSVPSFFNLACVWRNDSRGFVENISTTCLSSLSVYFRLAPRSRRSSTVWVSPDRFTYILAYECFWLFRMLHHADLIYVDWNRVYGFKGLNTL